MSWTYKEICYPIREGSGPIEESFCFQLLCDGKPVANVFSEADAKEFVALRAWAERAVAWIDQLGKAFADDAKWGPEWITSAGDAMMCRHLATEGGAALGEDDVKPWSKARVARERKKDVRQIRASDERLHGFTDEQLGDLWSRFSEETRCAGWLIIQPGYLEEFVSWAFSSPAEAMRQALVKGGATNGPAKATH